VAGTFGNAGLWAVRGSTIFTSIDAGTTWQPARIPVSAATPRSGSIVLVDPRHIWSVSLGPDSTGDNGTSTDVTQYLISRTADGGASWQVSTVPGNYPDTSSAIAFVDARHGFLLAAATRFSSGTSWVARTIDGGVTWSRAGSFPNLGSLLAVSDPVTVWAGGEEQAGGTFAQPALTVSRDAGRTWREVALPGVTGMTEAECGCYLAGPPVFVDGTTGFVTVVSSFGGVGDPYTRIERTTDNGRTWAQAAYRPNVQAVGLAILGASDWIMPVVNPTEVDVTADGGATWKTLSAGGAWDQTFPTWTAALGEGRAVVLAPIANRADLSALLLTEDGGRTWRQLDVR
jgi:photosystem II stability/assembly factor-like uncharacterized protein